MKWNEEENKTKENFMMIADGKCSMNHKAMY
jgi:hypothetical protein